MSAKRVLSVGQCPADDGSIRRTLERGFGAEVVAVDTADDAVRQIRAGDFALVLVNRIFDADGYSGLDFIRTLRADAALAATPVMLVSNFDDAQAQAVAEGAVPGFGKASLGSSIMLVRMRKYLE